MGIETTVIVDADYYIYRAAHAVERAFEWEDGVFTSYAEIDEGRVAFERAISELEDKVSPYCRSGFSLVLALSDSLPSFRKDFWPAYKANRKGRPLLYTALRQWVLDTHPSTFLRPRLEADDILGILMTNKKIIEGPKMMVSIDKDLKQVPGKLYDPNQEELSEADERSGLLVFLTQLLTGDTVDNYPGCPGVGPVRAQKLLAGAEHVEDVWPEIVKAYEKADLTEDDAVIQANVARILLNKDYDFKNKEPIVWSPPT